MIVLRVRGSAPEWGAGVSDVAAAAEAAIAVSGGALRVCDEQLAAVLRRGAAARLQVLAHAHKKNPCILSIRVPNIVKQIWRVRLLSVATLESREMSTQHAHTRRGETEKRVFIYLT